MCNMNSLLLAMLTLTTSVDLVVSDVCPGGKWSCPTGNTCCELPDESEGCCPYANATCCKDKIHCCPHGLVCDLKAGGCTKSSESPAIVKLVVTRPGVVKAIPFLHNSSLPVKSAICPDASQCPDDATCCPATEEGFGCCPLPNAVCCSDHAHCCPQGTECDSEHSVCYQNEDTDNEIPSSENEVGSTKSAHVTDDDVEYVYCPGGQVYCPNGNTCCPRGGGQWNCCPLSSGVCCADLVHCCPFGHHCLSPSGCIRVNSLTNGTTTQESLAFPMP